jgi:hypothetical protein
MQPRMWIKEIAKKQIRLRDCWDAGRLVPVAILTSHDALVRRIQTEHQNAAVFGTYSQMFADLDSPMTAVFRTMATEEQRNRSVLAWCYRRRFGTEPPIVESGGKFDSKTLHQGLQAGLCRLLRDKVAEKRRSNRFRWKWASDFATRAPRLLRQYLKGKAESGEVLQ